MGIRCPLFALLAVLAASAAAESPFPIFDAHVHYNLDIGRPVSVEEVFDLWRQAGIRGVLLTSRPNDGTRELLEAESPAVRKVAFARPYNTMADVRTWFRDPTIYEMVEQELDRGIYVGIGEFHIFGQDAHSEGFARFVQLAAARKLWLHAHCDDTVIDRIFALDPNAKVIWAAYRNEHRPRARGPVVLPLPDAARRAVVSRRHRGRQWHFRTVARTVHEIPGSLPARIGHLGARALAAGAGNRAWLSPVAAPPARGRGEEDRMGQRRQAVLR